MVDILLLGNCRIPSFTSILSNLLEKSSFVGLNLPGKYHHTAHCDYLLTHLDKPRSIQSEQAVWIIDHPPSPAPSLSLSGNIVAIVCSHDQKGLQLAAQCGVPAITCGLSPWDTVTLSSITTDSAQICLQRSVTSLSGQVIDPTEFPVRLSGHLSQEHLLLLCAALILCDQTLLLHNPIL